jgi:hypothetical protein
VCIEAGRLIYHRVLLRCRPEASEQLSFK